MSRFVFLFDLDSILTKQEILPTISKEFGIYEKMNQLTSSAVKGEIPFKQSFLKKVELLKSIPVSEVNRMIGKIQLNELLVEFVRKNGNRCYVVTGNLDVWIKDLMKKIGMEKNLFSSKALVKEDYIQDIFSIVDKNSVVSQMILPIVAVGGWE